jgi:hypothetical protein
MSAYSRDTIRYQSNNGAPCSSWRDELKFPTFTWVIDTIDTGKLFSNHVVDSINLFFSQTAVEVQCRATKCWLQA